MAITLNEEKRKSRVAWAPISRGGGNLEQKLQTQMRLLLDDFGIALEEESNKSQISIFVFPIFREFNLIGALASEEVLFAIAPSIGGLPSFSWLDWQSNVNPPKGHDLANAVTRELGWAPVSTLSFPKYVLEMKFEDRLSILREAAKNWITTVISEAERQARAVKINPIFKGRDFLVDEDLCFVLLPFRDPFIRIYNDHIKPVMVEMGLRVMKSDDIFTTTEIVEDIWGLINKAKIIVADVTGRNGNVFYELGIAHTIGKPVIILTQEEEDVPFDLRHLRYFKYSDNAQGWESLRRNLRSAIASVRSK